MNLDSHSEAVHGGLDFEELRRLGLNPDSILDFSSNILPCDPSPLVIDAFARARWDQYPDRSGIELREAIAKRIQVPAECIVLGNGASELIHLIARALIDPSISPVRRSPGDLPPDRRSLSIADFGEIGLRRSISPKSMRNNSFGSFLSAARLIVGPTFSEYRRASELAGANVEEVLTSAATRFALDREQIQAYCESRNARVIWLCNPNNPTGGLIPSNQLLAWIDESPDKLFVVDESYAEFVDGDASLLPQVRDNLIVLRSMTKSFAMAGLRLGYLVAPEHQCRALMKHRVPWSVNSLALTAGVAACSAYDHYMNAIGELRSEKIAFFHRLRDAGFDVYDSHTCYFLVRVGDGDACRGVLLNQGLLVRSCHSFGLPEFIRISVRDRESNERLFQALMGQQPGEEFVARPSRP